MIRPARPGLLLLAALAPIGALALPRAATDRAPVRLAAATRAFVAGLDEAQRSRAAFPFDAPERTSWNFVPGAYPGVLVADLDLAQRRALRRLLHEALSTQGALKTEAIAGLEAVLREVARQAGRTEEVAMRDPERYALAVFGTPSDDGSWGFRFQGHHVSLNFTIVDGHEVAATPKFLGANPHELRDGPFAGTRVLAFEEDAARRLLESLSDAQRDRAVIAAAPPPDVILGPGREADVMGPPRGLPWADLDDTQRRTLEDLVGGYVRDLAPGIAEQELARIRRHGFEQVSFAWMGGLARGEPHYYRIHGPDFVVEYDNVQNGANHSHTVWHDLRDGFGRDVLREHYAAEHRRR